MCMSEGIPSLHMSQIVLIAFFKCTLAKIAPLKSAGTKYRMRAIIGRSRFEAALVYKPRILGLKNEEYPFLVHKLSVL